MLYIVATPIGNLSDISFRALETLKTCDYILCEDTRHSLNLLRHYDIQKPLKSYHKFNEAAQAEHILSDLKSGKNIALVTDAGTPGISDPGEKIINLCIQEEIPVTGIPGPCAAIQALVCSGLSTERFQFWGFLPKKDGELKKELNEILTYNGTTICYESPHRLLSVLQVIDELEPHRKLVVARELTKKFEEFVRGTAKEMMENWKEGIIKGEIVLLFSKNENSSLDWSTLSIEEHCHYIMDTFQISQQEAIKVVAELRGVPKREIYNQIHQRKSD